MLSVLLVHFVMEVLDQSQEVLLVPRDYLPDLLRPELESEDEEAQEEEQLLFDALLFVGDLHQLFHDVLQVLFIINVVCCEVVVHRILKAVILMSLGGYIAILGDSHHALLKSDAQYLILQLHAESLKGVYVALPHPQEHLVQLLLRVFLVLLDPLDETVRTLDVLVDPGPLQYGIECLLRIALDNILLVGHELYDALQYGELA